MLLSEYNPGIAVFDTKTQQACAVVAIEHASSLAWVKWSEGEITKHAVLPLEQLEHSLAKLPTAFAGEPAAPPDAEMPAKKKSKASSDSDVS